MSVTAVNETLVALVDRLVTSKLVGGDGKPGVYSSANPQAVAEAFPSLALAQQLVELTGGTEGGNVGQVRAVRLQYEHVCAMARSEAVRRSSRVRTLTFSAARRREAGKGLRLPIEAAQTLLRAST